MAIPDSDLQHRLQAEAEQLELLAAALEAEHEALGRNDLEGLEAVIADKEARVARVQECSEARSRLLQEAGFTVDEAGMTAALEQAAPEQREALAETWRSIKERLQACQHQNEINGRVVREGMRFSRQALHLLVGGNAPGSELYGRDGNTIGDYGSRSHAKV
ncbi:MAG TPA: flagellar protein FlgN [Gammaproteobacteria bacterium]|nr:flagellar protein FlgN [Gammaproteobacteria bacterium]